MGCCAAPTSGAASCARDRNQSGFHNSGSTTAVTPTLRCCWRRRNPSRKCRNGLGIGAAVRANRLARDPSEGVRLPKMHNRTQRFLDSNEVESLAQAIDGRYQALVYVPAYGGTRWAEAVGLQRGRCELLRKRIGLTSLQKAVAKLHFLAIAGPRMVEEEGASTRAAGHRVKEIRMVRSSRDQREIAATVIGPTGFGSRELHVIPS